MSTKYTTRQLAIAIYTVNRHAKTATDNKELYELKKLALEKLIKSGDAKKIGLHFVEAPKYSKQHSTTLVQCADYLFHMIPEKEDFSTLPHFGQQDQTSRNPQERMSLRSAKEMLNQFIGKHPKKKPPIAPEKRKTTPKKLSNKTSFRSSYLDG